MGLNIQPTYSLPTSWYQGVSVYSGPQDSQNSTLTLDIAEIGSKSLISGYIATKYNLKKMSIEGEFGKLKELGKISSSLVKSGGISAIVSGVVSGVRNIYDYTKGDITGTKAGGNIVADVVGGFGGGIVACGSASLATKVLGITSTGLGAGIVGVIAGTVGFAAVDYLYRCSGVRNFVSEAATGVFEKIKDLFKHAGNPGGT